METDFHWKGGYLFLLRVWYCCFIVFLFLLLDKRKEVFLLFLGDGRFWVY